MAHSTNILPRSVDYDQTLILAIELRWTHITFLWGIDLACQPVCL
jgi:hypothetical protein